MRDQVTKPLISVLMPVFNGEEFLAPSIESILRQTYENFEFIIFDDGSTDNTAKIVRKYQKIDRRIIFISRENKGISKSLNEGIDLSSGDWIARMDSDDISLPDRFERQLNKLNITGADICGSWVECFGGSTRALRTYPEDDSAIKTGLLFGCMFAHHTVMARASLMKQFKYDSSWDKSEDYELWTRMALSDAKMTNISAVLLKYRVHVQQISKASSDRQRLLTQNIRRKYWKSSSIVRSIDSELADAFLNLTDASISELNMDRVDGCMSQLIKNSSGESRDIIFKFGEIAYLKGCQRDRLALSRWKSICEKNGHRIKFFTLIMMMAATKFRINAKSKIYSFGKNLYLRLKK